MELTDRKKQILKVVVEDYIRTAEPVGSKAIAGEMGGVSSATIRNELSDLTELGYLEQPHTSAGRVPSPKGYRLYVNELMERQRLSVAETERINQSLQMKMEELDQVISQAGRAVSSLMRYPAYVAAAGKKQMTARRFELLPVDEHSCIVVMMMGDNRVRSQLLRMQLKVDQEQMPRLVELLNSHFTGVTADEMNRRLMDVSEQVTPQMFLLLSQTIAYGILIGPENVSEALLDTSVVVASYDIGDDMRGLIGVVGPTRMDYASVAARLSGFAEGLTRLFGKQELPPKEDGNK